MVVVVTGVRRGKLEFWKNDVGKSSLYPAVTVPPRVKCWIIQSGTGIPARPPTSGRCLVRDLEPHRVQLRGMLLGFVVD